MRGYRETEASEARRERLERERAAGVEFNRILRERLETPLRLGDLTGRASEAPTKEGGDDAA